MMRATEDLKHEHRVIERMLTVIEAAAEARKAGKDLPPGFFARVADFVRNFADRCHHGKEEDNLFPALEKRGLPGQDGPIAVMLVEHDRGRLYARDMDEAGMRYASGDLSAIEAALGNALGYAELLRQHIYKEDNVLYRMADQVLTDADDNELIEKFEQVERERLGPGMHEKYLRIVEDLEREMGRAVA